MHIHAPFIMYFSVVVFQEINCLHILNMPMFVGSQNSISLPRFMFVNAAVSEIHELNQNKGKKNNSEIEYFRPFLGI